MESPQKNTRSGQGASGAPETQPSGKAGAEGTDDLRSPVGRGGRIDITEAPDDEQEASEESFPASDPPSYSPRKSAGSSVD